MILMSTGGIVGIVIAVIFVVLILSIVIWFIKTRNKFLRLQQDCDNAESRIDVYLTKRFDMLTKLVATVKGYAKHEQETLEGVIAMRNPGAHASMKEKAEFEGQMTQAAKSINVVIEKYPDLKANSNFTSLQNAITEVEENLQAARSTYNSNVSIYNKAIIVFPASIVAGSQFTKRDYFEAEVEKKKDVTIEF